MVIRFSAGKIVGNNLFYSMMEINALCRLDLDSMRSVCIGVFPKEEAYRFILHKVCVRYKDFLIFIPAEAKNIHIYNLLSKEIKAVDWGVRHHSPVDAVVYQDKLWIFPSIFEDNLFVLNLETMEFEEDDRFSDWCKKNINSTEKLKIHRITLIDDMVWFAVYRSSLVISFNLNTFQFNQYKADDEIFTGAFAGHDGLWLSTLDEKRIVKWSIDEERIVQEITTYEGDVRETGVSSIVHKNNKIYVIPGHGTGIYSYEEGNQIHLLASFADRKVISAWPMFIRCELYGNKLIIFPCNLDFLCEVNIDTDEVCEIVIKSSGFCNNLYKFQNKVFGNIIYREDAPFSLNEYIDVGYERESFHNRRGTDNTVGGVIMQSLKIMVKGK